VSRDCGGAYSEAIKVRVPQAQRNWEGHALAFPQAPLSLAVLMDGEQSIHAGRCLFPNAPHVTTKALPLLPPV